MIERRPGRWFTRAAFLAAVVCSGAAAGPAAHAESDCSLPGPRGPWGYFQTRDLPKGSCTGDPCTVWTRDSCPGTDHPGPAIRFVCACDGGTWRCEERERTKTACLGP
jgi:hypothetical protein